MNKFRICKKETMVWLLLTMLITAMAYVLIFHVWEMNRTILLDDSEDSIGIATVAQNYISGIEREELLKMPFPEESSAGLSNNVLHLFLMKVITLFCNSWGTACNLLYFLGYFLVSASMLLVLLKMDFHPSIAMPLSVIFSFLPYHYLRGEGHITLGLYYLIPFVCWLIYEIFAGTFLRTDDNWRSVRGKIIFGTVLMLLLGLTDIYYMVFACILLLVSGIRAALWMRDRRFLGLSFFYFCVSIGAFLINNIPFLCSLVQGGAENGAVMSRSLVDLDIYGLRIAQLLLPISDHRLQPLAEIRQRYDTTILYSETRMVTLGLILSCGLLLSLLCVLIFSRHSRTGTALKELGRLNIICIFLGTVGGFNIFVGMISEAIRCYNRISVFIASFCVFSIAWVLQYFFEKCCGRAKKMTFYAGMAVMLLLGLWDQTPAFNEAEYQQRLAVNENLRLMVQEIEDISPENAMIFMYPILTENENAVTGEMRPYGQQWPALYSDSLRWSGTCTLGVKDRNRQWKRWLSLLPFAEQLKNISAVEFSGIWLDQTGYEPEEFQHVKSELDACLGEPVLVSNSGGQFYYSLEQYAADLRNCFTEEEIESLRNLNLERGEFKGDYYGADSLYFQGDVIIEDNMVSIAEGGLQYGPYISLGKGKYCLTIVCEDFILDNFVITCHNGEEIIPYTIQDENDKQTTIEFFLEEASDRIEFVINNQRRDSCRLHYYYLDKNS